MESYIQISKINDFLYCPISIYLHSIYEDYNVKTYHQTPQVVGRIKHKNIDEGTYSTAKKYLQGIEIYNQKYNIMGKIDIYDKEKKILIERKTEIKYVYDGYKYQLYAQYFCLIEMGYKIEKLFLHSLKDNKRYVIAVPDKNEIEKFEEILRKMRSFDVEKEMKNHKCTKCKDSIYGVLSW